MVKNSKGGKGAKSLARKNLSDNDITEQIRFADDILERYAIVTKIFGNGMCQVQTFNESGHPDFTILCHIRNKFKGRSKRNHLIHNGSIVLIGLRDWENPYKNSDLLETYTSFDVQKLTHLGLIQLSESSQTSDTFIFYDSNTTTDETTTTSSSFIDSSFNSSEPIDFDAI
jgi:translation initiation factor IF-1